MVWIMFSRNLRWHTTAPATRFMAFASIAHGESSNTVRGATLHSEITVSNPDSKPLPWGFGTHAYFRLPLATDSNPNRCLIQAPAYQQWKLDACLPDGARSDVASSADLRDGAYYGDLKLDDVLSDLRTEDDSIATTIYDEPAGLQVVQRFDKSFRELVAFTPPWSKAVCLEPYTCVTDAINLQQQDIDAGLRVLQPGGQWTGQIDIGAGRVLV